MKLNPLFLLLNISLILLVACSTPGISQKPPETLVPTAPASSIESAQDLTKEEQAKLPEEATTTTPTQIITPYSGPIIDAHDQVDQHVELEKIIRLMNQAGVAAIILSTRGTVTPEELVSFADSHPGRIIPAVRTKGYMEEKDDKYYALLKKQVNMGQYRAMAEVLIYHVQKGDKAPLVVYDPNDEKVQAALNCALDKDWPFIAHIEFAAAGVQRKELMTKLEALLARYPDHPFVLIHIGQLDNVTVRQLVEAHNNIYFITSWSNPRAIEKTNEPWTNMFDGERLSTEWKQLMTKHPDRFILGLDNVFPEHWGQSYLEQVVLWRTAIGELSVEVAHAFAHGNAERLWHLQPVK